MTLQAQSIALGPQQLRIVAAVRFVAGRTSLLKCGWWQVRLLELLSLLAVTGQAAATGSGCKNPGDLPACGLWQATQSPCAPGCCTFAFSIFSACSL